jgi:cobalamin biosynthesis protein CobT
MAHGITTAAELARAVREFLEEELLPASEGRLRFLARVAARAVGQLEREFELGPEHERAHAARLARLGMRDDAELCAAIRSGSLDERMDEVLEVVRARVVDRLRVANPRYLLPEDAEQAKEEQAVKA